MVIVVCGVLSLIGLIVVALLGYAAGRASRPDLEEMSWQAGITKGHREGYDRGYRAGYQRGRQVRTKNDR